MAYALSAPCNLGDTVYKICPKCFPDHTKCDHSCPWFNTSNPCTINHINLEHGGIIVEKEFNDNWKLRDLKMFGETYFTFLENAERALSYRIENQNHLV